MVKRGHRRHGRDIGLFVHLSGSTSLNLGPNDKVQVCSVEEAIALGADAVSIHINLGAPNESKMLETGAKIARDCNRWGMPLLVMIYPRGKGIDPASPQTIGQCVRVAEELGADMIKTSYPGNPEAFARITKACSVPVFVAGGEKISDLRVARNDQGRGRRRWCWRLHGEERLPTTDTPAFVQSVCRVVHHKVDPKKALEQP